MESENPDDHQRVEAADEKKKRKRAESDRKYRANQKKKQESKEAQLQNLENECSHYKAQVEFYEKYSVVKPLLDGACKFRKLVLEPGESSGHAKEAVEKQTDFLNSLSRELLKTPLPGGGTCGSTSDSTDKDAWPPVELTVAAMKADGSVTTESFNRCQSLPEEWTQLAKGGPERLIRAFFGLREHYTATTARHAREIAKRDEELEKLKEELKWAQDRPYSNLFEDKEPPTL